MDGNGVGKIHDRLGDFRNTSVGSFLGRCGIFKFQLENDFGNHIIIELKEYLGSIGEVLLGEDIRAAGIESNKVLEIGGKGLTFSSLIDTFSNIDTKGLLSIIDMVSEEFTGPMGNYSLEEVSNDLEYANEIASIAVILQIVAHYPLRNDIEETKQGTQEDATGALEKKSYADMSIEQLHEHFDFLTVERRGRALQACIDKGWIIEKDAEKVVIDEEKGCIRIGLLDIELDDDPKKHLFSETASDDSPDNVDWEIISQLFVSEIEKLKLEVKGENRNTTQGEKNAVELEGKIKELKKTRDIAIDFFTKNVLNMRQEKYLITLRGSSNLIVNNGKQSKQTYPSTNTDKIRTVSFARGLKFNNEGPAMESQATFLGGDEKKPQHIDYYTMVEISGGSKYPVRRKYRNT